MSASTTFGSTGASALAEELESGRLPVGSRALPLRTLRSRQAVFGLAAAGLVAASFALIGTPLWLSLCIGALAALRVVSFAYRSGAAVSGR